MTNSPVVRVIVQTAFPVQFGIAKLIVSSPKVEEFAPLIASRKLPAPLSAVVVTVKFAAWVSAENKVRVHIASASEKSICVVVYFTYRMSP
jgi:hypothetical protein